MNSPVSIYLASAGIGSLTLVDFDRVERSNLSRQIVHRTADIDRNKVDSARDTLLALNPHVQIDTIPSALDEVDSESTDRLAPRYCGIEWRTGQLVREPLGTKRQV